MNISVKVKKLCVKFHQEFVWERIRLGSRRRAFALYPFFGRREISNAKSKRKKHSDVFDDFPLKLIWPWCIRTVMENSKKDQNRKIPLPVEQSGLLTNNAAELCSGWKKKKKNAADDTFSFALNVSSRSYWTLYRVLTMILDFSFLWFWHFERVWKICFNFLIQEFDLKRTKYVFYFFVLLFKKADIKTLT